MSARAATVGPVRVATWNVNSVKQRVPRLLPWLDQRQPDVVCLQETKLADGAFTELLGAELDRRGYAAAVCGQPRRAWVPRSGGTRGVRQLRRGPGALRLRAQRTDAGLRPLPLQARLAG